MKPNVQFASQFASQFGRQRRIRLIGILTSAIVGFASQSHALDTDSAIGGLLNPGAIVYSPEVRRVYVVERLSGALEIHDDARGTMIRVGVGGGPVSVAVDSGLKRAYIANANEGSIAVVDALTGAHILNLRVGGRPYSTTVDASRDRCFVTFTEGSEVGVIDCRTNTVRRLKIGSSDLVTANSLRGTVDFLGYGTQLRILKSESLQLAEFPIGRHAWALAENNTTGATYACLIEDSSVVEIDRSTEVIQSMHVGSIPCAIAVDSSSDRVVVANYGDDTVTILGATDRRVIDTVHVGKRPEAVAIDAPGHRFLVVNNLGDSVSVIDSGNNRVVATLPAGRRPYGLAVVPGSHRLYVANDDEESPSTVVDLRSTSTR